MRYRPRIGLTFTWTNSERSRKPVQISERCLTFETCVFGTQFRHGRQLIIFFFSFSVTLSKDKIYSVYVTPTCTCIPVILFRMSTAWAHDVSLFHTWSAPGLYKFKCTPPVTDLAITYSILHGTRTYGSLPTRVASNCNHIPSILTIRNTQPYVFFWNKKHLPSLTNLTCSHSTKNY